MRMLFKMKLDTEKSNRLAAEGKLGQTIGNILEQTKPECVYFGEENGCRTAFMVVDLNGNHEMPKMTEPWFLAFNAHVEIKPVMTTDDLRKADSDITKAAKTYWG